MDCLGGNNMKYKMKLRMKRTNGTRSMRAKRMSMVRKVQRQAKLSRYDY